MSIIFPPFSLQVLYILDLDILDFWMFTELAILDWFSTWGFKHANILVHIYFHRNHRWLNLVTYVGKCMDFILPIQVKSVARFPENTNPFIVLYKQEGRGVFTKTLGYDDKNTVGINQISEN